MPISDCRLRMLLINLTRKHVDVGSFFCYHMIHVCQTHIITIIIIIIITIILRMKLKKKNLLVNCIDLKVQVLFDLFTRI